MKGQLIFEFLIAGFLFFAIVLYAINYMNVNVTDFKGKFYQNRLQSRAVQISEILMGGTSSMSLMDNSEFNITKIQKFNSTYCSFENYNKLVNDLYLYETTGFAILPDNARIELASIQSGLLLACGPNFPRDALTGTAKAEIGRFGVMQNGSVKETVKLMVVVW